MGKDVAFTGDAEHDHVLLRTLDGVEAVFPEAAGMGIVGMLVDEVAGYGQGIFGRCREGEDAAEGVFLDEKIAGGESEIVLGDDAGIFEAIFGVQVTGDGAVVVLEVFGADEEGFAEVEAEVEVGGVLKLVAYVAAEVGNVPAHAKRWQ